MATRKLVWLCYRTCRHGRFDDDYKSDLTDGCRSVPEIAYTFIAQDGDEN